MFSYLGYWLFRLVKFSSEFMDVSCYCHWHDQLWFICIPGIRYWKLWRIFVRVEKNTWWQEVCFNVSIRFRFVCLTWDVLYQIFQWYILISLLCPFNMWSFWLYNTVFVYCNFSGCLYSLYLTIPLLMWMLRVHTKELI